jgi:uncharacterized membrane-anchored protein
MSDTKVTIKIPRILYEKIKLITADSGFNSPTDFIVFVLRDIVGEHKAPPGKDGFSPEEIQLIREKLKNLGYL